MTDELRDKSISSVMTDEIFAGSKQYIYRRIWKVRLRWGKGEVKRNDVMALKVAPKIPKNKLLTSSTIPYLPKTKLGEFTHHEQTPHGV